MFRKLLIAVAVVLLLMALAVGIFLSGGPEFPATTDAIIAQAIESGPPELVKGQTGYASSGNIKIWYELIQPPQSKFSRPKGTILLIMGAGASSMLWSPDWLQALANEGYRVIRFDNRGTGMSDWVASWKEEQPYSLEDMANDALAVLDANGVKQAHIVGVSMGGMIAQRLAISHADRVLSLVSMSTSAYLFDPTLAAQAASFSLDMLRLIVKYTLTGSESGMTKMWLGLVELMRSGSLQEKDVRDVAYLVLYEMRKRHGFNQQAMPQHMAAMKVSGSRLAEMGKIKCPVLVVHGTADDVVSIAHAKKYAPLIPNAKTLWLDGESHIIRASAMPVVTEAMLKLFESVKG
jgi:pimeloyl-ACP methyl ester carboxylesterase